MSMEIFMWIVGFFLFFLLLGMGIKRLVERYPIFRMSASEKYSLKEIFTFLVKDKATLKRLLFTVGMLIIFKAACLIPLPGFDVSVLRRFFEQISRVSGISFSMLFSGGALSRLSIFALGLMPYLSACVIIQLVSAVTPNLRPLLFSGEEGRTKIKKYTYILAICFSIIQSYVLSQWLQNPAHFQGLNIVTMEGWIFSLLTVVTLTGAMLLLIFIADLINRYGVGNGIAMIILSGIFLRLIAALRQLLFWLTRSRLSSIAAIFMLGLLAAFIYIVFYVTSRVRTIKAKSQNQEDKIFLPLRLTWVGKVPLSLAQSIYLLPATIAGFSTQPALQRLGNFLATNVLLDIIVMPILIFIFTYFYALVVFKPSYIRNLFNKYNFKPNIPEGKDIEKHLDNTVSKLLIITAVFLILISTIPTLISKLFKIPYLFSSLFGGVGVVIIVGIFFDLVKQIEFFIEKKKHNIREWSIAYIAFDEIEAEIKKGYLRSRGIVAEVEPLRFTWGMPIRTAVDQYRIYTPLDKREEARKLLQGE